MIPIYPKSKIYIMCPPNHATGGTELLHQLAYKLRKHTFNSFLYYFPTASGNPVHENFAHYQTDYVLNLEDSPDNILIMPEIYIHFFRSKEFGKIRKVVWWLSVDDYVNRLNQYISVKSTKPFYRFKKLIGRYKFADMEFFRRAKILHLVQSHYAFNFLSTNNIPIEGFLSDFLNKEFLNSPPYDKERKDYVLYNPLKGQEFTKKLISLSEDITWVPLQGMAPSQIAQLLSESKVYVDFGHHPGKDRFPREAAIMGCCVITGKRGSANFFQDIPIPDEFKFDEFETDLILDKIKKCLVDYETEASKLRSYISVIKNEEKQFEEQLMKIFQKCF